MTVAFAKRMNYLKASEIRELLKLTESPEIISFAGGLPAPELFPVNEMKLITNRILEEEGEKALQYATTEGFVPLREKIAARMNLCYGTHLDFSDIIITSGSQQGLDLSAKLFLDENDIVLCESPTYLGAINSFRVCSPKFIEVPTDDEGMDIDSLEKILSEENKVKLIYVVPDFQNPTGRTWSVERRLRFIETAARFNVPVLEDNPYGELRFEGEAPPTLKALDTKGIVIFLGTFSKTLCPGLRIGWIAAERSILEKYVLVKQGADLHTSTLGQRKVSLFMEMYDYDSHIKKLSGVYRRRRDLMIETMEAKFPEGLKFTRPNGGLFTWVELPEGMNSRLILERCLANNVAFVPGGSFFPNAVKENTFRLNYSNMPESRIVEGIKRLAGVLREFV